MHQNQLGVTVGMVRELVVDQFPHLAAKSITEFESEGTVNLIFRIGTELVARFPLQPGREVEETREWLLSEAEAARVLLANTSFPVPEPVGIGEPGAGYPLPWSMQTWLPGVTASHEDPAGSVAFAENLASFIEQVRSIETGGRVFSGRGRGGELASHDEWMETCFAESERLLEVSRLRRVWARFRKLPRESTDVMTHGDLVPGNVLVGDGRLVGVLDVGGLGPADPALDLVGAWHLLDREPRRLLRVRLGCGDLEWERGKAWAFEQAMGAAWYYQHSNEAMHRMGLRTLERILAEEPA